MEPLQDHLLENLDIVFIGFNPGIRTAETGFYYANPNNRFWRILYETGLTPRKYDPSESAKLLELKFGLTNIVSRPTKSAEEISKREYAEGREILKKKMQKYKPLISCYVGKGVYQQYSERLNVEWGEQKQSVVPGIIDFVAPSSSGLVRMKLDEVIEIYSKLPNLIASIHSEKEEN